MHHVVVYNVILSCMDVERIVFLDSNIENKTKIVKTLSHSMISIRVESGIVGSKQQSSQLLFTTFELILVAVIIIRCLYAAVLYKYFRPITRTTMRQGSVIPISCFENEPETMCISYRFEIQCELLQLSTSTFKVTGVNNLLCQLVNEKGIKVSSTI
uniref:Uncharacterized protein n=1 Tax=Glossina brevipalpis TaxID=37001 RepID=A0A1A9X4W5_9MUSC